MKRITVVADASLPYLDEALPQVAVRHAFPSQEITRALLKELQADALLIRSVTQCNEQLLSGTNVQFIATATAGTDHIDFPFCQRAGISVHNAPGCNAASVAQYIFASLSRFALHHPYNLWEKTIGIVGVGNVGRQVLRYANALGMKTLLCDPPRARNEELPEFVNLETLLEKSDIITFHVPLTKSGQDATYHLLNAGNMHLLKPGAILINAARGPVTQTDALKQLLPETLCMMLDCWEGEPSIDRELMQQVWQATPHIAGFSADSKARGSRMVFTALCKHFGIPYQELLPAIAPPQPANPYLDADSWGEATLLEALNASIDLLGVERNLRNNPQQFEQLRVHYPYHREPEAFIIRHAEARFHDTLRAIGFRVEP